MNLLLPLLLAGILQDTPPQPAVDPSIQVLVDRFFESQEQEDADAYLALWSANARRPTREQLQFIFDAGGDEFSDIRILRVSPAGDRARVRAQARRTRTLAPRAPGLPPVVFTSMMPVALTIVREGDEWKLLREGQPADELAAEMMEAPADPDREALLAAEPDLLGLPLLSAFARLGGAASAAQDFPRALRAYEVLRHLAGRGGFRKEEGEALQNIANAFYFLRRFPEALAAYEQRLAIERERGDDAGVALALGGIATIRYSYAEYTEALRRYREALAIQERLDDALGVAFTSISIGNIAYLQGDFHAAISAYRRSLELNRSMFNADGESRALEGLGRVYSAQGDYGGAVDAFESVLRDRRMQSARGRLGSVAQSLAEVQFRLGNLEASKARYEESRAHFEAAKDMPNVGRVMQGVALTELVAGRYVAAEDLYKRSGATCAAADDRICTAAAIAGLAYAQAAQEKYWDAVASYRRAAAGFEALGRREEAARSEVGLSQALTGAGDFAAAIAASTRARHTAIALENDDVMWRALTAEARAIRMNGDRDRAVGVARAAVSVLDRMEHAARERPSGTLTVESSAALATYAVLQAETGDARGAFATSERMRVLDVRAGLATNERDIAAGMTDPEREEERSLSAEVISRQAQLAREKALPKPEPARVSALQAAAAAAVAARTAFMTALYTAHPSLRTWRGLGPPAELVDASRFLLESGQVIVSFILDEDDLLAFVLARQEGDSGVQPGLLLESHVVPVKRRRVAGTVGVLQHAAVLGDSEAWKKAASDLVASLPAAVMDRLRAATRVIVLPHDVLWRVPFEALPADNGVLGDRAVISLAGSLEAVVRSLQPPAPDVKTMVGIAAPEVAADRSSRLRQVAAGWSLRTVEAASQEMDAVSGAFPPALRLTGAAATEASVRDAIRTPRAIHVAAPFRLNPASPIFSPILLSVPQPPASPEVPAAPAPLQSARDSRDDGSLELREVMNLQSAARLVVFSDGSATSMREGAAAADVLQWGWLAAGVPSVLVARWTAPGASSDRLLTEFYRRLYAGEPPAAALRAAQQAVRSTPATAAPIHWAGWLLLGAR